MARERGDDLGHGAHQTRDVLVRLRHAKGALQLLNEIPSKTYPSGMISIGGTIEHSGKYLLRAAFGEAKNKEDTIDMPITAGN